MTDVSQTGNRTSLFIFEGACESFPLKQIIFIVMLRTLHEAIQ